MRKVSTLFLFLLLCFLHTHSHAQEKTTRRSIGESISFALPESFKTLSSEEIGAKVQLARRPIAIYTYDKDKVEVTVNKNDTFWKEEDIELLMKFYKSGIYNSYTTIHMISERIETLHKKKYAVFEFIGEVEGDPDAILPSLGKSNYHCMAYAVQNNQIVIFNFSCPSSKKKVYQAQAQKFVKSIRM